MARGKFRPSETTILQRPWSSPLLIEDVLAEPRDQEVSRYQATTIAVTRRLRLVVAINNEGDRIKRHVKVRLTIRQRSSPPIVRTRTIDRIAPWPLKPPTVSFDNLRPLDLETKATAIVEIADAGAYPVRYSVKFIR